MANRGLSNRELQQIIDNLSDVDDDTYDINYSDNESESEDDNVSVASEESDIQNDDNEEIENGNETNGTTSVFTFTGKDGTEWSHEPDPTGRTRACNIIRSPLHKVCLPPGKLLEDPVDCFYLYMTNEIVLQIVDFTNAEAIRVLSDKTWKCCDKIEMYAFFGLLLTAGHLKFNNTSYEVLWSPIYGPPIFRATMGLNRFKSLLRFIRFDNKETRSQRRKNDKLAPIRDIWNQINTNLKKYYLPGKNLTVDEQLVPYRGRCPFKQYMPSKPDKYGMKIWWVCDSESSYPLNGIPYCGKEGNTVTQGLGKKVVESLTEPYQRTNRNVTFDNYFTDLSLAYGLLSNGLTMIGTVKKNKRFIPKEFQPHKDRGNETSIFGFTKKATLVSYVPKPRKCVILLSTMHFTKELGDVKNKPEIILEYNRTKGGVDTLDQMVHEYMCKRRTNRWPFAFFMNMLDVVGIAGYVIWTNLHSEWNSQKHEKRRLFLVSLAEGLIIPQIRRRQSFGLTKEIKTTMKRFLPEAQEEPSTSTSEDCSAPRKKRCHMCPSKKSRMQKQICTTCKKSICNEHSEIKRTCLCCSKIL